MNKHIVKQTYQYLPSELTAITVTVHSGLPGNTVRQDIHIVNHDVHPRNQIICRDGRVSCMSVALALHLPINTNTLRLVVCSPLPVPGLIHRLRLIRRRWARPK
jgi:hypothetical protein